MLKSPVRPIELLVGHPPELVEGHALYAGDLFRSWFDKLTTNGINLHFLRANGPFIRMLSTPFVVSALRSKVYRTMNGVETALFRSGYGHYSPRFIRRT
jgi:hypothetical protein